MIYEHIYLKDVFNAIKTNASLTSYCISNHNEYPYDVKRKTILVIPGGGYQFVSRREGEAIAIKFLSHNYNVFVLDYSTNDFIFPYPFIEAYAAIAFIRENADYYNVDLNNVGIVGFSAGGHLAATIANYQNDSYYSDYLNVDKNDVRIDFMILSYAVISTDDKFIESSTKNVLTKNYGADLDYLSIEKHINNCFPKTFIWATETDAIVPYKHSLMLKKALDEKKIPNKLVIYENGEHGGSTCDELTCDIKMATSLEAAKAWIDEAISFLNNY